MRGDGSGVKILAFRLGFRVSVSIMVRHVGPQGLPQTGLQHKGCELRGQERCKNPTLLCLGYIGFRVLGFGFRGFRV